MGLSAGAVAGISAAISAVSAIGTTAYTAYAQNKQAREQQKLAEYNAQLATIEARNAEAEKRAAVQQQNRENERLKARQRALYAKAGVQVGAGTPLAVQGEQAAELNMRTNEVARQGSLTASRYLQQANLFKLQGQSARAGGRLQATGTILGGLGNAAAQVGSSINSFNRA